MIAPIKNAVDCIATIENWLPFLWHMHVGVRRGRPQKPYVLRLRNGIKIRISGVGHDWYTVYEVFLRKTYTGSGQKINVGDTVVDIGANIGCFSLLASKRVGDTGRVISIEPDPQTFQKLVANIALNNADNIHAVCVAIGDSDGTATLFRHANPLFSSLQQQVDGRFGNNQPVAIQLQTLESLFQELNIDSCQYLKMDCEGSEYAIVRSLSAELAARISQLTVELHAIPGESEAELDRALKRNDFSLDKTGELSFYHR